MHLQKSDWGPAEIDFALISSSLFCLSMADKVNANNNTKQQKTLFFQWVHMMSVSIPPPVDISQDLTGEVAGLHWTQASN